MSKSIYRGTSFCVFIFPLSPLYLSIFSTRRIFSFFRISHWKAIPNIFLNPIINSFQDVIIIKSVFLIFVNKNSIVPMIKIAFFPLHWFFAFEYTSVCLAKKCSSIFTPDNCYFYIIFPGKYSRTQMQRCIKNSMQSVMNFGILNTRTYV